eukprot:GILJ01012704.1.p1 GENE.GILJ01012704.1~~GILJ01012704.1.p1  ORF type:complete len:375 (+),score=15.74 GILJ01012704.1:19-1143(+)
MHTDLYRVLDHCSNALFDNFTYLHANDLLKISHTWRNMLGAHYAGEKQSIVKDPDVWSRLFKGARTVRIRGPLWTNDTLSVLRGVSNLTVDPCTRQFSVFVCDRLHTLNISGCRGIVDEDLTLLSGLKNLNATYCTITGSCFEQMPNLENVNVSCCTQILNSSLSHLQNVRTLNISICHQITDDGLSRLSKLIESLDMTYCDGIVGNVFEKFCSLRKLDVTDCQQITDSTLRYLQGVEWLDIGGCKKISDSGFQYLGRVRTLIMSRCDDITDNGIKHLRNIQSLDISVCHKITDRVFEILPHLTELFAERCLLTDNCFALLQNIQRLDISECPHITGEGIEKLFNLRWLCITGCDLTEQSHLYLRTQQNLTLLN